MVPRMHGHGWCLWRTPAIMLAVILAFVIAGSPDERMLLLGAVALLVLVPLGVEYLLIRQRQARGYPPGQLPIDPDS
jgi:hypothetical protein